MCRDPFSFYSSETVRCIYVQVSPPSWLCISEVSIWRHVAQPTCSRSLLSRRHTAEVSPMPEGQTQREIIGALRGDASQETLLFWRRVRSHTCLVPKIPMLFTMVLTLVSGFGRMNVQLNARRVWLRLVVVERQCKGLLVLRRPRLWQDTRPASGDDGVNTLKGLGRNQLPILPGKSLFENSERGIHRNFSNGTGYPNPMLDCQVGRCPRFVETTCVWGLQFH